MNRTGPREPLPVHQLLSSLLEPEAPVASWYERLLPCSGTLPQRTRRWGEAPVVVAVVGAFRSLSQVIFIQPLLNRREQRAMLGPGMAGLSWQAFFDRSLLT